MKPILSPTCLTFQIFSSYHLFDPLEMFHMIISGRMPVFITFHRSKSNMFAATKPTPSPIDPVKSPDLHRFFAERTPKKRGGRRIHHPLLPSCRHGRVAWSGAPLRGAAAMHKGCAASPPTHPGPCLRA